MQPSERHSLSAFIVCKNEERQIRRCLDSVSWCDEIVVVVDQTSSDSTAEICREYTDKVLFRGWTGYVDQKRFGLEHCTSTWVLNLDADEVVSDELADEIRRLLASDEREKFAGFMLNRVVFYLGRWWRKGGWYPEYRLRLCKREKTTWGGVDPHEKAAVDGPVRKLTGELKHFTYSGIRDHVQRLNSHSSAAATSLGRSGKQAGLMQVVGRPLARFFKFYIARRGYREGRAGFYVAVIEAFQVFLKYAKLWELVDEQQVASRETAATQPVPGRTGPSHGN